MSRLVPPYPLIFDQLCRGRVVPFLGSGASLGSRGPDQVWRKDSTESLPTGSELARYLAEMTAFPEDEPHDLAKVAQYYDVVGGRARLNEELRSIFDRDYPVSRIHEFLAGVPRPLLIVTTNYDDLIERAFDASGRAYDLVIHSIDPRMGSQLLWRPHGAVEPLQVSPNKLDIDLQEVFVIYKMHGAVDRRMASRDQFVITEDDYIDFLARMTKNKAIPAIFAEVFLTSHFLFLGYGLYDWNLRVVLNRIEKDLRRPRGIKSWAIQFQPKPLERRFWVERGVELFDMTVEEFVAELGTHRSAQAGTV